VKLEFARIIPAHRHSIEIRKRKRGGGGRITWLPHFRVDVNFEFGILEDLELRDGLMCEA